MLVLFPDRAPDGDIIKATVGDPGHRLLGFEWRDGLTHRR
jgi:hypothetical protein